MKMRKKHIRTILLVSAVLFSAVPAYATGENVAAVEESTMESEMENGQTEETGESESAGEPRDTDQKSPMEETTANTDETENTDGAQEPSTKAETETGVETVPETTRAQKSTSVAKPDNKAHKTEQSSDQENSILLIEKENAVDADGNVTMTVNTADDVVFPLALTMKGPDGAVAITISRSGQQIKIIPGEYKITKAIDGNEKKLPSGAYLQIPEDGGIAYLDFNKPEDESNPVLDFILSNIVFIPIALLLYAAYKWYVKYSAT